MYGMGYWITLALGVFLGNWIVVPLVFKRTFKEGFFIGIIAAVLILIFALFVR